MADTKLSDDEWLALRDLFTAYLNGLNDDEPLPDDYFQDHIVHLDLPYYGMYRHLVVELLSYDEGGSSMLYLHCAADDITNIEFASHTFDTSTVVWKTELVGDWRPTKGA